MSEAVELVKAILGPDCPTAYTPRTLLDAALEQEVDPLRYCATAAGLSESLAMERAAEWAGLAFCASIPIGIRGGFAPQKLEALAEVRVVSLPVLDRKIAFAAPDFFGLIRLRRKQMADPRLRGGLCLTSDGALRDYLTRLAASALISSARQNLIKKWPFATAKMELTLLARCSFVAGVALLLPLVLLAPHFAQPWLLPIASCVLLGPAIIRLAALFSPPSAWMPLHARPENALLPHYSVLIPLRDEAAMVPQLFAAMRGLDYPAERLDIKFLVESRSPETVAAVERRLGDPRFSLVAIPDALPHTKPKALDFALPLCKGEFVVVFDAEDIPDPDQLWRAATAFRDNPQIECLQASLLIANGRKSWLAALFAGEYAGLFSVLLPALAQWQLLMPLGGTSNHFRLATLRQLGGWDAYNVTEDADIGVRLARRRLRVGTLTSATRETAPTQLRPWMGQRTRWMKGWMQTFIVHNRNPAALSRELGLTNFLLFETLVLGMIVTPFLHAIFMAVIIAQLALGLPFWPGEFGWSALYGGFLALGYGSAAALTALGLKRVGRLDLLANQILLPIYWLLMAVATVQAMIELLGQPFYWFKSPHAPVEPDDAGHRPARFAKPAWINIKSSPPT